LFEAYDSAEKNCNARTVLCLTEREQIVLASDIQVHGFKPCRSRRILHGENILSTPSLGGIECRQSHVADLRRVKEHFNGVVLVTIGNIPGQFSPSYSSFPCKISLNSVKT
jgi:hypothetical protein